MIFSVKVRMDPDSGDEIFITQNTFRSNLDAVNTQAASEAAEFLDEKFWEDIHDDNFPEEITYWDFTDHPDNSSTAPSTQEIVEMFGDKQEPFVPIVSDEYFADDEKVSLFILCIICSA